MNTDCRMYVFTHKLFSVPSDPIYHPLHCGRALSDDLGYPGDDIGDSISEKNKSYAELTGAYWVWKNVKCDIVGFCHYRRYFVNDLSGDPVNREYIEDLLKDYDVILPKSVFPTGCSSLWDRYEKAPNLHTRDLVLAESVISEMHPGFLPAFRHVMSCNLFSPCNMLITGKEIYDSYCEWLYSIFFEMERRIDLSDYTGDSSRIFGFLGERMTRIWLMNMRYRIREIPMVKIDQ